MDIPQHRVKVGSMRSASHRIAVVAVGVMLMSFLFAAVGMVAEGRISLYLAAGFSLAAIIVEFFRGKQ